jgi:hypothetical protein
MNFRVSEILGDLLSELRWMRDGLRAACTSPRAWRRHIGWGGLLAGTASLAGLGWVRLPEPDPLPVRRTETASASLPAWTPIPIPPPDYHKPMRDIPARFPLHTRMPTLSEASSSRPIAAVAFDFDRDIVWVDDSRVWWESDHDGGRDTEEDRLMHWAMEDAFRRLAELVCAEGGLLKVQDAYRAEGIHSRNSLHKQGRAIDLTSENMSLARLAALCWAAGFDWVYYEKSGGLHIHASVSPAGKIRRTFPEPAHVAR